ncbi:hypothetical protein PLICRDRAFT_47946 [Plicaturopsis crispa FD-325 SS-3]|nr:hypothetical protein PLICRDRAFT_47946 [Plicaturopsis crispa FD-325 SS-3]
MAPVVHNVAQTGFGTGTNELYDRARPSYPPSALAYLREVVNGKPPLNIAEIGSGTGIFTRALLAHPDWSSAVGQLKAIEPSEGMRATFAKNTKDKRVSTSHGTFHATGVEDGWADLVILAQAYHWCHPEYDAAAAEFARILKPDGVVIFIWNLEDRNGAAWVAQLRKSYEEYEQGTPQFRLGLWRATFDTPSYKQFFVPPEEKVWNYPLVATSDIVVQRILSKSYIAVLPEDKKAAVSKEVQAIVEKGEGKVWVDEANGVFEYPYYTKAVVMRRK